MNHVIIGCGGVGSWLATLLAKTERGILLVDGDKLEKKNLDRQLFNASCIGMNKAEALASILGDRVKAHPEYYLDGIIDEPLATYWCAVDNNRGRREVKATADRLGVHAIFMANETYSSEAYYYDPLWRGGPRDPLVYYPELAGNAGIDPLARSIGCTGEALDANPQLATANFMAAALGAHLWKLYTTTFKDTPHEHLAMLINTIPCRLNANLSSLSTYGPGTSSEAEASGACPAQPSN